MLSQCVFKMYNLMSCYFESEMSGGRVDTSSTIGTRQFLGRDVGKSWGQNPTFDFFHKPKCINNNSPFFQFNFNGTLFTYFRPIHRIQSHP